MKKTVRKIYMCILMMILVMCFAACEKAAENPTSVPDSTNPPKEPVFSFQLEGTEKPEAGKEAVYKLSVKDIKTEDDIIGLDFNLTYNTDLFTYVNSKITKSPTSHWWLTDVNDAENGKVEYHSCGDVEEAVITGDGQYEVTITFQVKDNAETDKDWLVRIETGNDAQGTDYSASFNVIYGTGSEIKRG